MEKDKILYKNEWFSVIEKHYKDAVMTGIDHHLDGIVILPYILKNNVLEKIGVIYECNPLRKNNFSYTLITGGVHDNETTIEASKRELLEEGGFDVKNSDDWTFLGYLTTSKQSTERYCCYCVNITEYQQVQANKDGSPNEYMTKFEILPLNKFRKTEDSFILSVLMKFLENFYSNIFEELI